MLSSFNTFNQMTIKNSEYSEMETEKPASILKKTIY